jgi:hypothetical protein
LLLHQWPVPSSDWPSVRFQFLQAAVASVAIVNTHRQKLRYTYKFIRLPLPLFYLTAIAI